MLFSLFSKHLIDETINQLIKLMNRSFGFYSTNIPTCHLFSCILFYPPSLNLKAPSGPP